MKLTIHLDENIKETEVSIRARERDNEVEQLVSCIQRNKTESDLILGYDSCGAIPLSIEDIHYFYTESKKVYANSKKGILQVKKRLYELEELGGDFLRISNDQIVRIKEIEKIDLKYSGTIMVQLKNGDELYVSRRYMSKVRTAFGLGGKK